MNFCWPLSVGMPCAIAFSMSAFDSLRSSQATHSDGGSEALWAKAICGRLAVQRWALPATLQTTAELHSGVAVDGDTLYVFVGSFLMLQSTVVDAPRVLSWKGGDRDALHDHCAEQVNLL